MATSVNAAPIVLAVDDPDAREVAKIIADALLAASSPSVVHAWAATTDTMSLERQVARALRERGGAGADELRTQVRGAPGAKSTAAIMCAACAHGGNGGALGVAMGRGCRPAAQWDRLVAQHVRPGELLIAAVDGTGAPGFPVATMRPEGGIAVVIRPFIAPVPQEAIPVALVVPTCICGALETLAHLASVAPDALLPRASIAWSLRCFARGVPVRAATCGILRAMLTHSPPCVQTVPVPPLCRDAQRAIGVDVEACVVYGQGSAGLTLTPDVDEVLAKVGKLLNAPRA